jgi:hypothetical protein
MRAESMFVSDNIQQPSQRQKMKTLKDEAKERAQTGASSADADVMLGKLRKAVQVRVCV